MNYQYKKYLAKQFRKNPTKSEKILWQKLRNKKFNNLKFKRQYNILGFILDFYCPKLKLAIEIDGPIHKNQKGYDYLRQKLIEKLKIKFFRVNSENVEKNSDQVLDELEQLLKSSNLL